MNKKKVILALFIISFSVLLSSFGLYFHQMVYAPNFLQERESRMLMIPSGATFKDVQNLLHDGRYVNDLLSFSFLAKLMSYHESVKSGLYIIERGMSNMTVVRMLRSGEQQPVNVTFNNVRMIQGLPEKITKNLEIDESAFMALLDNDSLIEAHGFDSLNILGMFIPNTYQAYWTVSPQGLFNKMKKEYDSFWNKERRAKAEAIGLSPKEVSILASIVQAETQMSDERPVVAGLYLNRLKRGIHLMADPTLVFAALLNKHKKIDSPYNTYKHSGLPPGPINMPSISSLEAVLNHKKHRYIYMCAKEDFSGYHNFATNLIDHNRNAVKFQRAMNRAGIYK